MGDVRSRLGVTKKAGAGFSLVELMTTIAILLIVSGMAIPTLTTSVQNYRAMGNARGIAAQLALARMRAASDFTTARLNFNLTANTYQLEIWSKTAGAYQVEGGVQSLSQDVTFGFGTVTTPVGGQTTIAQPSPSQITFNSRGYSVDSSGNPIGTAVIYIRNTRGVVWAVTTSLAGQATARMYTGAVWKRL